jgi:hypothetical protein
MTRMPGDMPTGRTVGHAGSPEILSRIPGSGDVRVIRSRPGVPITLPKHLGDCFAADRARDQVAQQRQVAFQPATTPTRCVGGSFGPKSPAIAMQGDDKINIGDVGKSNHRDAKLGAAGNNFVAPRQHDIAGELCQMLSVEGCSAKICVV